MGVKSDQPVYWVELTTITGWLWSSGWSMDEMVDGGGSVSTDVGPRQWVLRLCDMWEVSEAIIN